MAGHYGISNGIEPPQDPFCWMSKKKRKRRKKKTKKNRTEEKEEHDTTSPPAILNIMYANEYEILHLCIG